MVSPSGGFREEEFGRIEVRPTQPLDAIECTPIVVVSAERTVERPFMTEIKHINDRWKSLDTFEMFAERFTYFR